MLQIGVPSGPARETRKCVNYFCDFKCKADYKCTTCMACTACVALELNVAVSNAVLPQLMPCSSLWHSLCSCLHYYLR